MNKDLRPEHTLDVTVFIAGVDWDAVVGYDVVSTPARATQSDPADYLELDVWYLVLKTYACGDGSPIPLPAGVDVDPRSLGAAQVDGLEQQCIDDWEANHSPGALWAERDEFDNDSEVQS
jgi:hypothetical protein